MSTAEVGLGGPQAPRVTLVARLQARATAISGRLRAAVARLLDPDDGALAAWAAAFAKAPQAVPNLPLPPNRRLTRIIIGAVVGAHVALLLVLYWRSTPPPPPQAEMTVELVREMPEQPKPKPETKEAPKPAPLQPGDDKAKAEGRKSNPASQQGQPEAKTANEKPKPQKAEEKPKPEEKKPEERKAEEKKADEKPKPEPKPKAERQAKPAHQHQAHRAPQPQQQQQQAQAQPKPAQEQPAANAGQAHQDNQMAMPAVALPGASDAGTDAVSYSQLVLSQVAKAKKQGRYMGIPGYAGVRFSVADDGSLASVKLVMSSGDPNLDIEAEAMIRRAAPFPKPPPGGRRDYGITLVFAAQPAP